MKLWCRPGAVKSCPKGDIFIRAMIALGDQNFDHVSILIDGPPQIAALSMDGDEEFIDVPDAAESSLFPTQGSRVGWSEFLTPVSYRFVGDKHSSLRKQVFYVSKAQGEPMLQPYGMTDGLGRKSVTTIAWSILHSDILADW